MNKHVIILWIFSMACGHAKGQKEGDTWIIGYANSLNPDYSVLELGFETGNLNIKRLLGEFSYSFETCSTICDDEGNPLIWTNGMELRGRGLQEIEDTISYVPDDWDNIKPSFWNWWYSDSDYPYGFPIPNGAIILPDPSHRDIYHVIYQFSEWFNDPSGFICTKWLTASIRTNPDSSFTLLSKDIEIGVSDVFFQLPVKAVRHANGRDWWLYMLLRGSSEYQLILLDPDGFHFMGLFDSGIYMPQSLGLATISPKGNFMAAGVAVLNSEDQFVYIYQIDRCTGNLSFRD